MTATPTRTATATPTRLRSQQIVFKAIPAHKYADAPFTVSATGGTSGNPVTFQTRGNCTATGKNGTTITLIGTGSCTVTAFQAGSAAYAAASPVSNTFNIARGRPSITWAQPGDISYGTPLSSTQLNALAKIAGRFTYVPGAGTLLPVGSGQPLSVTFTPADTSDYESVSLTTEIEVVEAIPDVVLGALPNRTYGDGTFKLSVTGNVARTTTSYVLRGACRNGGPGGSTVTITGAGLCTVYAYQPGNKNCLGVSVAPRSFSIAKARPKLSWPSPALISVGTPLGKSQLAARATFQGRALKGTFSYSPKAGTKLRAGQQKLSVTFVPSDGKDFVKVAVSIKLTVLP